jgi:hypothetical protein
MNKKILILINMVFIIFGNLIYSQASSIIDLEELENPRYVTADKNILLIEDNSKVKMFAMKDFRLIKTIGGKGEGPAEFKNFACPQILSDSIMVSSTRKVSFFDFSGELIKEQKTNSNRSIIKKIKDKYVSDSIKMEKDDFYISYNIYSPDFTVEKVLYKGKWAIHKGGEKDLFEIYFFDAYDGKVIFAHREGFKIEILDENGNNLHTIKANLPRIPFTDEDMEKLFKGMEVNTKNKGYVQSMRKSAIKPDYYPAIRACRIADGKIYVVTYLKEKERSECLIFNMEGKQLKKVFIPLKDTSPIMTPLFTISNGHLYQLIDNEAKELYQLVVDKIE